MNDPEAKAQQVNPSIHWKVFGAGLLCALIATLLCAERLVDLAGRLDFGPGRDRAMAIAERIQGFSQSIGADRPLNWVDARREEAGAGLLAKGLDTLLDSSRGEPSATAAAPLGTKNVPKTTLSPAPNASDEAGGATPTAETTPDLRIKSRLVNFENPLRVWVAGDSFADPIGNEMSRIATRDRMIISEQDGQIATALTRPDYFDWEGRIAEKLREEPLPEVVVLIFIGNENQNMLLDTESAIAVFGTNTPTPTSTATATLEPDETPPPSATSDPDPEPTPSPRPTLPKVAVVQTDAWEKEYGRRASRVMDLFKGRGIQVYWVGMPEMRDPDFSIIAEAANRALASGARSRPWVDYVDTWAMFQAEGGGFSNFLEDDFGKKVEVRKADGIHFTRLGSDWVVEEILERMNSTWDLVPPTSTPTATNTPTPSDTPTITATASTTPTKTPRPTSRSTALP